MLYNEIDPFAADWLVNLINAGEVPRGIVDRRSITELQPEELIAHEQVHLFAGIGGWPLALRLAGWSGPVWTGSCPCQPWSAAGQGKGTADERHLWPEMFRLIRERRPATIFGEQVASKAALEWLDGVFDDLEGAGYACGASDLCAASIGAPHIRQRIFWVADAGGSRVRDTRSGANAGETSRTEGDRPERERLRTDSRDGGCGPRGMADTDIGSGGQGSSIDRRRDERSDAIARAGFSCDGDSRRLGDANSARLGIGRAIEREQWGSVPAAGIEADGLGDSFEPRSQRHARHVGDGHEPGRLNAIATRPVAAAGAWSHAIAIPCRDGKSRRISAQSGDEPLAYGIPRQLGPELAGLGRVGVRAARSNRVGRLRGYGNAIVPHLAAEFIRGFMETRE